MTRRGQAEAMLNRYGESVTCGGAQCKAIIRPLDFKSGTSDAVRWLYTGPAAHKPSMGGTVAAAEQSYTVKRCDTVLLDGEELYVRAILGILSPSADTDVRLERGGTVLAYAESYMAKAAQGADALVPWGESAAEEIAEGAVLWELTLTGVRAESGVNLFSTDSFSVIIVRAGETTTYSGCRWKKIQNSGGPAQERSCSLEVLAASRSVEQEVNANGCFSSPPPSGHSTIPVKTRRQTAFGAFSRSAKVTAP